MNPPEEHSLRSQLGIPGDARQVLVLAESSHWDPDWLLTWDEYFNRYARHNLDMALDELLRDPRRIYSIECTFFLQKYWDANPERQATIRDLVNSGRLRLTSTGVTTADTLIPSTEAILRDWLVGQEWLRRNGMTCEPTLAYFPDSFGCSHSLPSLLHAAGFTQTAITRIDGMLFMGCDWPFPWEFQWPGSSAAILLKQERSLDFIWRDNSGGEVLSHWNAFTYGQGDMLAYTGLVRMYLYPLAVSNRSDWNVTRHIHHYARQLKPYSRTPYLFCPIGFDFVSPIPELVSLLDRYNERHYPETGLWVVNAGLDDYLNLVACHRQRLPVLELDPNPYWTGFYTSRPTLKALAHASAERLLLGEYLSQQTEDLELQTRAEQELTRLWADLVISNHHDFITGTGTDRIVEAEQRPWLQRVSHEAEALLSRLEAGRPSKPPSPRPVDLPEWAQVEGLVEVRSADYHLTLAEEAGGCIVCLRNPESGEVLLENPSNDMVCYADSGGLWRMGHEFIGGTFHEADRASLHPARLQVHQLKECLEVASTVAFGGIDIVRRLWLQADSPVIRGQVRGRTSEGRTLTLRFATGIRASSIVMDEPGGVCTRPVQDKYVPTFWPVQSFAHICGAEPGRGAAVFLGMPGAVACRAGGALELITHRNAQRETAFGVIHFPGLPATGHERGDHNAEYALFFTSGGDWLENQLLLRARSSLAFDPERPTARCRIEALAPSLVVVEPPSVIVTAVKAASRGDGLIIRLLAPAQPALPVVIQLPQFSLAEAWLCDARERDLRRLKTGRDRICLSMPGSIATVRIRATAAR